LSLSQSPQLFGDMCCIIQCLPLQRTSWTLHPPGCPQMIFKSLQACPAKDLTLCSPCWTRARDYLKNPHSKWHLQS
jgi:hypothetical protein